MLNPVFSKDEYRLIRSGLFLILAISELLPIGYAILFFNVIYQLIIERYIYI